MSKILSRSIVSILTIALSLLISDAKAQCNLVTRKLKGVTIKETPVDYQYLRTETAYEAASIKAVLTQRATTTTYALDVSYTTQAAGAVPAKLVLKFQGGRSLAIDLKISKHQKTDDSRTSVKLTMAMLSATDITEIMTNPLAEIAFEYATPQTLPPIPVTEPLFIKTQLACLQTTVK